MSKKFWSMVGAVVLALHAGSALAAVTLWDNGGPGASALGGSGMSDTNQAQDFTLGFTSDLTAARFWNLQASANDYAGSIFYQIVNDAAGTPGSTVYGSGTATPTRAAAGTVLGLSQFQNDFSIAVSGLLAGTYWIELHNGPITNSAFSDFYWSWADIGGANGGSTRGQEDDLNEVAVQWTTNDSEHAFAIFGDRVIEPPPPEIPEPATLALTGVALSFLAMRRRRWL